MRFERGADRDVVELAARRFAELLAPSGATLAPGSVDERGHLPDAAPVRVRTERVNALLGTELTGADIRAQLEPIGFAFTATSDGTAGDQQVVIPSFRPDTATETDIIEEVARHWSYSRLPRTVPPAVRTGRLTERQHERRLVRQIMVGMGLDEAMPMPFLSPGDWRRAGLDPEAVTLTQPADAAESVLRTSPVPACSRPSVQRLAPAPRCVPVRDRQDLPPPTRRPAAADRAPLSVARRCRRPAAVDGWCSPTVPLSPTSRLEQVAVAGLHPTRSAEVVVDGRAIGVVGEVDPEVLGRPGGASGVAAPSSTSTLLELPHGERRYREVSRYPSSDIDLAFEVDEGVPAGTVEATLRTAGGDLLADVRLFDVYRGEGLADGRRSLAYALRFQAPDHTLTDADIADLRACAIVSRPYPARLRASGRVCRPGLRFRLPGVGSSWSGSPRVERFPG
jgi:phenylalanyl-tRNA synthetase beta chain